MIQSVQRLMRRWALWGALFVLIVSMLTLLIWFSTGYEIAQKQAQLDQQAQEAASDLHVALMDQVHPLQSLQFILNDESQWQQQARQLLRTQRALVSVQSRDVRLQLRTSELSPFRELTHAQMDASDLMPEIEHACALARRQSMPAFGASVLVIAPNGVGVEALPMCLPLWQEGRLTGYLVATYSLTDMLATMIDSSYSKNSELSFVEADGTKLAVYGRHRAGDQLYTSRQILELTGTSLVLQMDMWHEDPELFPNVLTALIVLMSVALIVVLFMLANDTQRRMKVEHDLAEALAFRKAMEDSLVTGLRARDKSGRITYVNPAFCAMVGFEASELLGLEMPAPYWPPEMIEEYRNRQKQRLTGQLSAKEGAESIFMRKNGERFPVLIFEAPLINAQGVQTGWMSAVLDVSEQRRVEEISRASQERLQATARLAMVGEMASLLSHELNQPLAAISSYANGSLNLLNEDPTANQELNASLRGAIERIANQAGRAGQVIKSVHDFVRRRDQTHEAIRPKELLGNVMPLIELQARKLRVRVQVLCPEQLPLVFCDRTMVEQVLLNLARNGMQAMDVSELLAHSGSPLEMPARVLTITVRVASAAQGRRLEFDVGDVGVGIGESIQSQLFTPFFTTKAEGMGLGLSLCRTVVEQHGGSLTYTSNSPCGTIFRFTLPQA
jgi:two-component system, LuxR family, sensor histidine kinase DctS